MILSLFFTRGNSLQSWVNSGLLEREKLIYEGLARHDDIKKIYWVTYGSGDKKLADKLHLMNELDPSIVILQKPFFFPTGIGDFIYSFLAPVLHYYQLKSCDIYKSNQMDGAWSAVISKYIYGGVAYIRTGFTWSLFSKENKSAFYKQFITKLIEKLIYRLGDIFTVSSSLDRDYVLKEYNVPEKKIKVLGNFVDLSKFKDLGFKRKESFLFVGRLHDQKNLINLIKAFTDLGLDLTLVGDGVQANLLKGLASDNCKIQFLGKVSNNKLPEILNKYKYFILPSYFEGMPKTLLEALACGCICFGTDVPGIREVLDGGKCGVVIPDCSEETIKLKLDDCDDLDSLLLKKNAKELMHSTYSLDVIIDKEYNIIKSMVKDV